MLSGQVCDVFATHVALVVALVIRLLCPFPLSYGCGRSLTLLANSVEWPPGCDGFAGFAPKTEFAMSTFPAFDALHWQLALFFLLPGFMGL
jgi:hypothetical protein